MDVSPSVSPGMGLPGVSNYKASADPMFLRFCRDGGAGDVTALGMRDGKLDHQEWGRGVSRGEMAQAGRRELSHGLPVMSLWSEWPRDGFPFLKE